MTVSKIKVDLVHENFHFLIRLKLLNIYKLNVKILNVY